MEQWSGSQETAVEGIASSAVSVERSEARPCFFHRDCGGAAEIEKQGKAVCRPCASGMNGIEYPLRAPSREPLYRVPEELAKQLGIRTGRPKRARE